MPTHFMAIAFEATAFDLRTLSGRWAFSAMLMLDLDHSLQINCYVLRFAWLLIRLD